jgi:uroporphyrinogen-III decarboxylase
MIDDFWGVRHVINLGHGMWPVHKPESVKIFTDFCREYTTQKKKNNI